MVKYINIALLFVASVLSACYTDDTYENGGVENSVEDGVVEILDDGSFRVRGQFNTAAMGEVSVSTRAGATEDRIYTGWCLVLGEDETERGIEGGRYTLKSPILDKVKLEINANGTFFLDFNGSEVYDGVLFLRFVVNLTPRETEAIEAVKTWRMAKAENSSLTGVMPTDKEVEAEHVTTFSDYVVQSVGLDGIYSFETLGGYNTKLIVDEEVVDIYGTKGYHYEDENNTPPNPTLLAQSFPMSSPGFVLEGISEETLHSAFKNNIRLVRTCSKVSVSAVGSDFDLKEVCLIGAAQESRLRSTVISDNGDVDPLDSGLGDYNIVERLDIPVDLGGAIDYLPLAVSGDTSDPIYFYPNAGGEYDSNSGLVNNKINPQYVIFKGRAADYDTDGYYKVALKAKYPLEYEYNEDGTLGDVVKWSNYTYDVLRNTNFTIKLINIDKPGYKNIEDAKDPENPASNISYSIAIDNSDGRSEILISNGVYYAELAESRVYVKGYSELTDGVVNFSITPSDGNYSPRTYVLGDYQVNVTNCVVNGETIEPTEITDGTVDHEVQTTRVVVPASNTKTNVVVNFKASGSGRIRIRIGDILKYIPVEVDPVAVSSEGEKLDVHSETHFAYEDIYTSDDIILNSAGYVTENKTTSVRELDARLYMADGFTQLYLLQNKFHDPNEKTDDNTVDLETVVTTPPKDNATQSDRDALVAAVAGVLDEDHTQVYIDQSYNKFLISTNGNSTTGNNVFNDINDIIEDRIKDGELPADYTYSYDLSAMEREDDGAAAGWNTVFKHMADGLFSGNERVDKLILPASTYEIHTDSFNGCTALMEVNIGSEIDPAYDYNAVNDKDGRDPAYDEEFVISANAFRGMTKGCKITIYTTSDMVCNNAYSGDLKRTPTGKYFDVPIVTKRNKAPVMVSTEIIKYEYTVK